MPLTLTDPLSETLHSLMTRHAVQERNKELALALVEAAGRGEPGPLTGTLPAGAVRPVCDSVLADGDRVVLRLSAAGDSTPRWCLLAELRFDGAGRVVEYHGAHTPLAAR
ncbi:hypothetical protein ACIGO6_38890 [Streptomyces sp. NPDC053750]|uniref:hypothetical protein n=1 Tax=Streptomyces sp. NPDC053750 TaxID=3365714 RepID=UPI0037D3A410